MKKTAKFLVPLVMGAFILASIVWYLFIYDREFTRDTLLSQARYQDLYGNSRLSAMFYNAAYKFSDKDEGVAVELANQYKHDGNFTKAEVTLTEAIKTNPAPELYTALSRCFVEQDKLLDAVQLMESLPESDVKDQLEALRPAAPAADQAEGYHSQYISLRLTSLDSKYIFYTLDGEYPSTQGALYTNPVPLPAGETTVYAIAVDEDGLVSPVTVLGYTITGVIEEVTFTDEAMEAAIRAQAGLAEGRTVYTNDLWDITEFTAPEGVKTYADLKLLPNLAKLTIRDKTIDTLSHLSSLARLTQLDLSGSAFPAGDLAVLASLPALSSLDLSNCGLSTIENLNGARNLTCLNLANNTLRNLDVLAGMTTLAELNLDHNAVTSLAALSPLENLTKLTVNYNAITSLSPLSSCIRLTHLEADHNQIAGLNGVEKLALLTHLSVDYNQLTSISQLAGLTELTNLSIASNALPDITHLKSLTKLQVLDFSGNLQVSVLPAWPDGCALTTIDGSYNSLTSIDGLKNMQNLTHVYMDYNQLTNIDALENCFCLVQVNVFGNAIPDVEVLRDHDIIVNYDPTAA